MKIKTITPITSEIIETDDTECPTYRRSGPDSWENLMGESWEPVYNDKELEALYQEFKRGRK